MRTKILSNRYEFIIELERNEKVFYFEILCLYKLTKQKSTITNLNFIISELVFPILGTTDVDTTIYLNNLKGIKLFQESISTFKDQDWIKLLEEELDEDRNYGGWNSNYVI